MRVCSVARAYVKRKLIHTWFSWEHRLGFCLASRKNTCTYIDRYQVRRGLCVLLYTSYFHWSIAQGGAVHRLNRRVHSLYGASTNLFSYVAFRSTRSRDRSFSKHGDSKETTIALVPSLLRAVSFTAIENRFWSISEYKMARDLNSRITSALKPKRLWFYLNDYLTDTEQELTI